MLSIPVDAVAVGRQGQPKLETSSFDSLQSFRRRRRNQLGMEIATLLNKKLLNEGGNDINLVNEKK